MGAEIVDSLTVEASTFLLDALPTAGTGSLLLGRITDGTFGNTALSGYFRIGAGSAGGKVLPDDAVYDSAALILHYNRYYYGDTSSTQQLMLYRLTESLKLTELSSSLEYDELPVFVSGATLWANQAFAHEANAISEVSFKPRPLSGDDTVRMRVDDVFGNSLFRMVQENDTRLANADEFADYIKGFVLKSGGEGDCVVGFRDSLLLKVYYSYENAADGRLVRDTIQFSLSEPDYQYNAVAADRSSTVLSGLLDSRGEVDAAHTGYQTFIQGSTGLVTRLRFPTVKAFVNQANLAVSLAQLIIETPQSSHSPFTPPPMLNLMVANKYGTPVSLVPESYGSATQRAYLIPGDEGGGNGKYVFNLTQYVSGMRNTSAGLDESLLLTLPVGNLMSTVDRLVVAASAIRLRILYVKF